MGPHKDQTFSEEAAKKLFEKHELTVSTGKLFLPAISITALFSKKKPYYHYMEKTDNKFENDFTVDI